MARTMTPAVVRQIGSLFDGGSVAGLSDRQLVERFADRRDPAGEAAFAALITRHGPMVLGICRRLLGDLHLAEDAFQAVFLVLARKAGSIQNPDLLGNWLYGVAIRTSRKARVRRARRRKGEEDRAMCHSSRDSTVSAEKLLLAREQAAALHDEIDRLPGAFRLPVVLCYFEGLTLDEAARRLRCPAGTLRSRLARAREKLRRGLTRRGVLLPATALAAFVDSRSTSASVSSPLCDITTRAAVHFTAGQAAAPVAAALAQEVLRLMLFHKLKITVTTLLFVCSVAAGAGYLTHSLAMTDEPMRRTSERFRELAARSEPRPGERPQPAARPADADPGQMTVTGRALDQAGKPAAGVPVDIIGRRRAPQPGADVKTSPYHVLGRGATDSDGRFRIEAPRTSTTSFHEVYALAGSAGPGTGLSWTAVNPDAEQPTADVRLRPEQMIRGRLVDVNGQPAAGVNVQLREVSTFAGDGVYDGLGLPWAEALQGTPAWPKPVITDPQGRFTFAGIGRGFVSLHILDPRFARQRLNLEANERDEAKEITLALQPATIIEGRAIAADTGQPFPGAAIAVRASVGQFGAWFTTKFQADDQGRFQLNPTPGDYFRLRIYPNDGQPYLVGQAEIAWAKGAVKKAVDVPLRRGVLIRGKAVEEGTGRPVVGAGVQFRQIARSDDVVAGYEAIVASKEDGSFQVAVPPGKGYLMILGSTLDFIPQEIGGGKLFGSGEPGGRRFYAHDIIAYEVKPNEGPQEITATLRRGKTLRGRVVGPAGQAVENAVVLARQPIDPINLTWQDHDFVHARDGRFTLHGFDPEKATPVYFLDAEHQWGAAVEFSGKLVGEEQTIRLQPCGQARARFVGPEGKPVARLNVWPYFQAIMTPGPSRDTFVDRGKLLQADAAYLPNVDPRHYRNDLATDSEGRVVLPALIPGAPYRISDWSTVNVPEKGFQLRKEFTVKPGETVDLGDILIENPQR